MVDICKCWDQIFEKFSFVITCARTFHGMCLKFMATYRCNYHTAANSLMFGVQANVQTAYISDVSTTYFSVLLSFSTFANGVACIVSNSKNVCFAAIAFHWLGNNIRKSCNWQTCWNFIGHPNIGSEHRRWNRFTSFDTHQSPRTLRLFRESVINFHKKSSNLQILHESTWKCLNY